MKIGVFCSANNNISQEYFTLTQELGEWMAKNGHTVVYGGCDMGLMKTIGHSVHDNGGQAIGVVPQIIEKHGIRANCLDVDIPVDNLSERKDIILSYSDVIIALPGGVGTIDEIFTVAAGKTIGYHNKTISLYNMNGFSNKTLELMEDLDNHGMIRGDYREILIPANNLEEIIAILEKVK